MHNDSAALEDLVRSATCGDQAALDEVLLRIRPVVLRRCSRFLPHQADAEDAAQDALLIISRKITSYTGRGSFLGWVTVGYLQRSPGHLPLAPRPSRHSQRPRCRS